MIFEGEETKKLNRGGRRSVRHLACEKALASCPYIVDLTDSVVTEAPAATRNGDLFPAEVVSVPPLLLCREPALKKVSAHKILD